MAASGSLTGRVSGGWNLTGKAIGKGTGMSVNVLVIVRLTRSLNVIVMTESVSDCLIEIANVRIANEVNVVDTNASVCCCYPSRELRDTAHYCGYSGWGNGRRKLLDCMSALVHCCDWLITIALVLVIVLGENCY